MSDLYCGSALTLITAFGHAKLHAEHRSDLAKRGDGPVNGDLFDVRRFVHETRDDRDWHY